MSLIVSTTVTPDGHITAGQSTFPQVSDLRRIWFDPSIAHQPKMASEQRKRGSEAILYQPL